MRAERWSAFLMATALLASCTVAGPRPDGTPGAPAPGVGVDAEPEVRVGVIVDAASARVDGTAPFELVDESGRVRARGEPGSGWTVRRSGSGVEAGGSGETVRVAGALIVRPRGDGRITVDGKTYRGSVLVRPAASGVTVVNLLDLETYLLGVVPLEIGAGRPPEELEAVKAQAIAARTYAIRHMGRREALGFDFYGSVLDQVYGGADAEDPVSSRAVRDTRGEIIVYEGEPIEAYYHSTCGGRTAALEEVWPGDPRPYLQSVSDRRPGGGWYCETSNRFRWTEEWGQEDLHAALTDGLESSGRATRPVTRVEAMEITGRTPSGRAAALALRTNLGGHVVAEDSIRWVLRPEPNRILNSTAIELNTEHRDGEIVALTVEGAGWGHGIGMCQIGAVGRARDGASYRDILLTYYPGTRIARLYR